MPLAITPQVHCSWAIVQNMGQKLTRLLAEWTNVTALLPLSVQVGISGESVEGGIECEFEWLWWKALTHSSGEFSFHALTISPWAGSWDSC